MRLGCLRPAIWLRSDLGCGSLFQESLVNCMPGMGQRGFWDEQQRVEKLKTKKPVLERLSESIPWESFRPLLEKGYAL